MPPLEATAKAEEALTKQNEQPVAEQSDAADMDAPSEPAPAPKPAPASPPPFVPKPTHITLLYMLAGVLLALTQGFGMSFITINLQQIAGPMGLTQTEATWLQAAYLFPNASLTLMLFKIRAQYGLRNFAEVAIVVYALVCFAHFWVETYESALALRFVAGLAAAPMTSLGFLYTLECLPPAKKMTIGLCTALTALIIPMPLTGLLSPSLLDIGQQYSIYLVELGFAMICLGLVYMLPLASPPRAKVISFLDIVSYIFLAISMGCFAVAFTVGRLYWWTEVDWIAWLIIIGIASGAIFAMIELNRTNHLVDIRWLASKEIIHFTGTLMVSRLILSEQTSGAINFLRINGMQNEQLTGVYLSIIAGAVAAAIVCIKFMRPGRESTIHAIAFMLMALGSYMDSLSTSLTRPEQMYLSQFMVSFAGGIFLPPALMIGMAAAMKRGPSYILSFIVVFLAAQKVGSYFGSALYGTFVQWREQFHSFRLVSQLSSTDPLVATRLKQLSGNYGKLLTDPTQQSLQGASLLAKQVQQQAYTLAYNDSFLFTAYLSLGALACLCIHVAWRNRHKFFPQNIAEIAPA